MILLKDKTKEIRFELKSRGINNKKLNITFKISGYDEYLNAIIKDLTVSFKLVYNILKQYRSVRYDERSGEVPNANVDFDKDILRKTKNKMLDKACQIFKDTENLNYEDTYIVYEDKKFKLIYFEDSLPELLLLEKNNNGQFKSLYSCSAYDEETLAEGLTIIKNQYNLDI